MGKCLSWCIFFISFFYYLGVDSLVFVVLLAMFLAVLFLACWDVIIVCEMARA